MAKVVVVCQACGKSYDELLYLGQFAANPPAAGAVFHVQNGFCSDDCWAAYQRRAKSDPAKG